MKQLTYDLCGYSITSYGNGTSYLVQKDAMEFFLQGDDASHFADELETVDDLANHLAEYMANLGVPCV